MQSAVGREDGRVRPGDWRRCSPWIRSRTNPRCLSQGIAGEDDFEKQAELAAGVVMWYQQYVRILRRLSGRTPVAVSGFCGAGGTDEGIRRCGGASVGFDAVHQPHCVARFGAERFSVGDGMTESAWRNAAGNHRPFLRAASPPCAWYSTGRLGEASQPALISTTRDLLERADCLWWIENVLGAASSMASDAVGRGGGGSNGGETAAEVEEVAARAAVGS